MTICVESCYQELFLSNAVNQSVVISGESGSGKTETAKMILSYLVSRIDDTTASSEPTANIDTRLIQSSPVLEAFGNSSTLRNPNSSRFGKFMKINISHYDGAGPSGGERGRGRGGRIVGASVETYLLEKSRVISQSPGEQNFHIFYQLLAGGAMSSGHCSSSTSDMFRIVNAAVRRDNELAKEQFLSTQYALQTVGYDTSLQAQVWQILTGVLYLGNVEFSEVDSEEGAIACVLSNDALEKSAACLGISVENLTDVLTRKVMRARGEEFTIRLTAHDACFARDATCKAIYEALFADIVRSVNMSLHSSDACPPQTRHDLDQQRYIGVLDIFGFESFAVNRFDQLLINYANESLQNTFNMQLFRSELQLLLEENIECALDPSMCPDNSGCVDTIWISNSQIRSGECSILTILDAVSKQPKPLDDKFCAQLHHDIGKSTTKQKHFPPPHPKDRRSCFLVKHFAGVVKYTVNEHDSWVAKNNDSSPDSLPSSLQTSQCSLVRRLLPIVADADPSASDQRRATQVTKNTIAASFAKSMSLLNAELHTTRCAFVRCIKPNAEMTPGVFDSGYVVEQMRALGLVQACEVMKVGLPSRMTYADLKTSLAPIVREVEGLCVGESEEVVVASLLLACEVDDESYRLGRTRVFFKPGKLAELEAAIRAAGSAERRVEMLQRLRQVMSSRRELHDIVQRTKGDILIVEAEVSRGWAELESLQRSVGGQSDDGSTTLAITCSEATAAVDSLGALIDTASGRVNDVRVLVSPVVGNVDYAILTTLLEDIDREMTSLEDKYRSIKIEHSSLCTQRKGKSSVLQDASLDRWQDISRIDDVLKTVRSKAKGLESAAMKLQVDKVITIRDEVIELVQGIRDGLKITLHLVRENMAQLGSVSVESARLAACATTIINDSNELSLMYETICGRCDALSKEFDRLQIVLARHEEERMQKEREQHDRDAATRKAQEEAAQQQEATAKAVASRRGSVKALNVAALRKNISNMSVERAVTSGVPAAAETTCVPAEELWVLPEGWEEFYDAANDLPYYFNTLTQETQWEKPTSPAQSVGGHIQALEESSRPQQPTAIVNAVTEEVQQAKSTSDKSQLRSESTAPLHCQARHAPSKCSLSYGRITTAQLDSLGVEVKQGVLLKKSSGALSRFKKKYFVLEGSVLTYYDKAEQYLCGSGGGKEMRLSTVSSTSYTDAESTFIVKSPQLGHDKELVWMLVAENTGSLHEWVAYINAHIHAIHRRLCSDDVNAVTDDEYWRMGTVCTTFWLLPTRNAYGPITNPVGIRSVPDVQGAALSPVVMSSSAAYHND